jgi:hypothetical protein
MATRDPRRIRIGQHLITVEQALAHVRSRYTLIDGLVLSSEQPSTR